MDGTSEVSGVTGNRAHSRDFRGWYHNSNICLDLYRVDVRSPSGQETGVPEVGTVWESGQGQDEVWKSRGRPSAGGGLKSSELGEAQELKPQGQVKPVCLWTAWG